MAGEKVQEILDGQSWLDMFPECFADVGLLKDLLLSLHIDPNVKPVAQPVKHMPFGHKDKAKAKAKAKLEGPKLWVSSIVTVPKDGDDIRLCVDKHETSKESNH